MTVRSFLDTASESLNGKFTDEPLVEALIRDTIGWAYRNLGELEAAEPHLERAVELYESWNRPEEAEQWRSKLARRDDAE